MRAHQLGVCGKYAIYKNGSYPKAGAGNCGPLFADGFESGDTGVWSSVGG
ncbi:MAG: hypothetical protein AB1Z65_18140 [Candidatus Sulfomarinibacteraceae bacterium]